MNVPSWIRRLRAAAVFLSLSASAHAAEPGDTFRALDCNRCHHVPGVEDAVRQDSCTGCHRWIKSVAANPAKRAVALEAFPLWERYERNVATYLGVPSLNAAMVRLDPAWVRTYLQDPHDLRPTLPESMPRLKLTPEQLDTLVGAFEAARAEVPATPPPNPARVAQGEALFTKKMCNTCHAFGAHHTETVNPLSPDLAHTRARMSPDHVVAWILSPSKLSTEAVMPTLPITEDEALALRDYVLLVDPGWSDAVPLPDAPPPHQGPVDWATVEERVFGKICVHCHMKPELNQGRAGPGNAGGFGWPASGIELQTREGVMAAADKVRDAMLRRRIEAHRDVVAPGTRPPVLTRPEKPGMPLGLPAISDEDLSLVLGWIDQGMPP